MSIPMPIYTRGALAWRWVVFLLAWLASTLFTLIAVGPCRGDSGVLYGNPGSARTAICNATGDYLHWGEPGWLVAIPRLLPVAILITIGVAGVRRRNAVLLKRSAVAFSIGLLLYLVAPHVLP